MRDGAVPYGDSMSMASLRQRLARVPPGLVDAGWVAAVAVALSTAGAAGYLRWALLVAGWFVAGPIVFRLFVDPEPVLPVLGELIQGASLWLATLLLGERYLFQERGRIQVKGKGAMRTHFLKRQAREVAASRRQA
jgi:hypothetical protein